MTVDARKFWLSSVALAGALALVGGTVGYRLGLRQTQRSPRTAEAGRDPRTATRSGGAAETAGPSPVAPIHASPDATAPAQRWADLRAGRRTPASEREMAAWLRALARAEPQQALELAAAETNLRLRAVLRDAALSGWAEDAPTDATAWALGLRDSERVRAVAAVLAGVSSSPEQAGRVAEQAARADPSRAAEYAEALIAAMDTAGEFEAAAAAVVRQPGSPQRLEQAERTFAHWAEHEPELAAKLAASLSDSELRAGAVRGLMTGWGAVDPVAAAEFALTLPAGETRAQALAAAVPRWVEHDAVAAATWLAAHDRNPDFDMGVVALATVPSVVAKQPEVAINLAQSISDGPLRANTLRSVALKWAESDPASARQFVESSEAFGAEEKTSLLAEIRATGGGS